MAVKATNQVDIVDLTDGYSVDLSYTGITVPGDLNGNASNVSNAFSIDVTALCGSDKVSLATSSVAVTAPTGITAGTKTVSNGVVTVPFSTTTALTGMKVITFEVAVTTDLTLTKKLPVTVAKTGATGATPVITATKSGTVTTITADGTSIATINDGTNGTNGLNQATVTLYQRAASVTAPSSGNSTYTFSTGVLSSVPSGWSQAFPAETQGSTTPVWMIRAVASANTATDTIAYSEWSTPVKIVSSGSNGTNGTDGANGLNQATIFLYQRAATSPSKPSSAVTYTFSSGALSTTPSGWSRSVPAANGNPCWVTQAVAVSNATTYSIASTAWTDPTKLVEDGLVLTIESSAGTIFKNTSAATTLTANVFQGGNQLSSSQIAALGTVKWYKDGSYMSGKDGLTLSISAGDVTNKASYTAKLEG